MKDIHKDSIIKYERAIQNDSRIYLERYIHQDIKWQRYIHNFSKFYLERYFQKG